MATKKKETKDEMLPATIENYAIATADNLKEVLRENLGGQAIRSSDFEKIKIPSQGSTTFMIPGLTGEEAVNELEGVIILNQSQRAYWSTDDGDAPPDCTSDDCETGRGNPGGSCAKCPFGQFGSAEKGKGQACKMSMALFILRPDGFLPYLLRLPPTSLKNARSYMFRLSSRGVPYYGVTTKITLEKDKSADGKPFARAVLNVGTILEESDLQKIKEYREGILPALSKAATESINDDEAPF